MSDNIFWALCWAMVVTLLLGFTSLVGSCSIKQEQINAEIIKSGVDPLRLSCSRNRESPVCGSLIVKDGAK